MCPYRIARPFAAVALGLILFAPPARSDWSNSAYENTFVVSNGANGTTIWDVLADGNGGAYVLYSLNDITQWDIYAQHIVNGNALWGPVGVGVATATGQQNRARMIPDGAGGIFVCWADNRTSNTDVYLSRLDANGSLHAGWPASGLNLCTHAQSGKGEGVPYMVADGSGGVVVAWLLEVTVNTDYDVYGARATADHVVLWSGPLATGAGIQNPIGAIPTGAGGAIVGLTDGPFGAATIKALRCGPTGALEWGGIKDVCSIFTAYGYESIVPDDAGGAFFTWTDERGADLDIYATRISGITGTRVNPWIPDGNPVCIATNHQFLPTAVSDGTQGLFVAWSDARNGDYDIYAQHLVPEGLVRPGWVDDGIVVASNVRDQQMSARGLISDGGAGAILAWTDERRETVGLDVFAIRLAGSGVVLPAWNANGNAVSIAPGIQSTPYICTDGASGMIAFWQDSRTPNIGSMYTQRVDRYGILGDAGPDIVQVADVSGDQGGKVRILWEPSYLDSDPGYAVDQYWIWRQVPAAMAMRALASGARLYDAKAEAAGAFAKAPEPHQLIRLEKNAAFGWEYIASQPASAFPTYSYTASTTTDSSTGANPRTYFMVQARYAGPGVAFWDSAPDSGYSVDNLAPPAPSPFTATLASGQTTLHWGSSQAPDFALYRLYRGVSSNFTPSAVNKISEQNSPDFLDTQGGFYYYKLAAVDVHGNTSPYALAYPTGTTDVPDAGRPHELTLDGVSPSPMRGAADVRFELARAGHVSLAVIDPAGRLVRELARAQFEAGEHRVPWSGDDARGRALASGVYFIRLEAEGRFLVRRFVKLD